MVPSVEFVEGKGTRSTLNFDEKLLILPKGKGF